MSSPTSTVGVVGATGYAGAELVALLYGHPFFSLEYLGSRSFVGDSFADLYPRYHGDIDRVCEPIDPERCQELDLVFLAVPHGESMGLVSELDRSDLRIVDLGADYRFVGDPGAFENAYDQPHTDPEGLNQAVYGLTEYAVEKLHGARLVANPGCYATAVLVPLRPVMERQLLDPPVFIDAKSGISGAGRSPKESNTFVKCNEDIRPYRIASHRHEPEMRHNLPSNPVLRFVPHVIPVDRGIEAAIYARPSKPGAGESVEQLLRDLCDRHELFRYREQPAGVKAVANTPYCDLSVVHRDDSVLVFSYLDNLQKGAASQAIQNANLMFDRPHTEGLLE